MKLYDKLKDQNLVENHKDFLELIRMRTIKINDINIVDDPNYEMKDVDKNIKIGILDLKF